MPSSPPPKKLCDGVQESAFIESSQLAMRETAAWSTGPRAIGGMATDGLFEVTR